MKSTIEKMLAGKLVYIKEEDGKSNVGVYVSGGTIGEEITIYASGDDGYVYVKGIFIDCVY
jgi:hypothetical protein